jgi:hypothetical protein
MTTEPSSPTKAELLAALRASAQEVLDLLQALPDAAYARGCYENGWNGREILAHIASIEWTYPRLIDIARQVAATPADPDPGAAGAPLPTRSARGGIDAYNQRQVEQRKDRTVAELIEEFRRNRAATIAAVEATDEALFAVPIRSAGGISGTLTGVLFLTAVRHPLDHARDIVGHPPSA